MTRKTVVKARPHNATLRALLDAFGRKEPTAWMPLVGHLEELGAEDLAEQVRDYARRGGMWGKSYRSPKRLARHLTYCAAERGILSFTDEREHRQAFSFQAALAKLDLSCLPRRADLDPGTTYKQRAMDLRHYLYRLKIPHVSVRVRDASILVELPYRQDHPGHRLHDRKLECEACQANNRAMEKFRQLMGLVYPEPPGPWAYPWDWGWRIFAKS